jgi:endonuclease/exonuclease/phosphatase family metal-dependent hydrolase
MKRPARIFSLAIVVLLMGAWSCTPVKESYLNPKGPNYYGYFAQNTPDYTGKLKIISYNIQWSKRINDAIRELQQEIDLKEADILLLQEMDPPAVVSIASSLQYNYILYPAARYNSKGDEFGNAILTRWPIKSHRKVILPHEHPLKEYHRIAVFATLEVDEFEVLTCCVHTHTTILGEEKKLDQVQAVVNEIYDNHKYVIVGGDFNSDTEINIRKTDLIFSKAGFIRGTKGLGYTTKTGPLGMFKLEMDHIFIKGLDVVASGKVETAEASDHLPVWVVVEPEEMP